MELPCNLIPSLSPESESQRKGIGTDTASKAVRHGLLADWKEGPLLHPQKNENDPSQGRKKVRAAAREASFVRVPTEFEFRSFT
ncbi:hypothetical protein PIB30_082617 [Stylosanthes scabra]|uniref:Uncharacterized protein n=1 Tax=Stylosanthes scabra TaxID=79078 RepID=A0ABU6QUF2_9FABA|nr:hypothetical protein [Stylosanthes scabra]